MLQENLSYLLVHWMGDYHEEPVRPFYTFPHALVLEHKVVLNDGTAGVL